MDLPVSQAQLTDQIKTTLAEVPEERGDLSRDAVEEALEDLALCRAIREGEASELIDRPEVFKVLEGRLRSGGRSQSR